MMLPETAMNCNGYDVATCKEARYEAFFRSNCNLFCGFCTEKPSCE